MKRILKLSAALLAASCAIAPVSASASALEGLENAIADLQNTDLLIEHSIYQTWAEGDSKEYSIFYYGHDNRTVVAYQDEIHMSKADGYTMDDLTSLDINTVFPGYNDMSFADVAFYDDGDYYSLVVMFTDLDDADNAALMDKNSIIEFEDPTAEGLLFDADSLLKSAEDAGYLLIDPITSDVSVHLDYPNHLDAYPNLKK